MVLFYLCIFTVAARYCFNKIWPCQKNKNISLTILAAGFSAIYATLWNSTTSIRCNVSPWRHICSSINASGIILLPDVYCLTNYMHLNFDFANSKLIFSKLIRDLTPSALLRCLPQMVSLKLQWVPTLNVLNNFVHIINALSFQFSYCFLHFSLCRLATLVMLK